MKKDYSEYKPNSYELYDIRRRPGKDLDLEVFRNHAMVSPTDKTIRLAVYDGFENDAMEDLLEEYEQMEKTQHGVRTEASSPEEDAEQEENRLDALQKNRAYFASLQSRYRLRPPVGCGEWDGTYFDRAEQKEMPLNNVLSGMRIDLRYGEGILDFVYADFDTPFQQAIQLPLFLEEMAMLYREQHPEDAEQKPKAEKVYHENQRIVQDYFDYIGTLSYTREICYASLYTAICPPAFREQRFAAKPLRQYYQYLKRLQQEYKELLEFCFDESFYPKVLGHMMPSERFSFYKSLHGHPNTIGRYETFRMRVNSMSGSTMPFGMDGKTLCKRMSVDFEETDEHRAFAEQYGIDMPHLLASIKLPTFINVGYSFNMVHEILDLEFTKMLEIDMRFRKCQRCGKYFIMKGNYDTKFCDRVAEGETKSCQELAAQEHYKQKVADNAALPIYSKYYKRYAARVKVRQIKEADFKKWKFQALVKRDECTNGIITVEEFVEWLEGCFPNRKKK